MTSTFGLTSAALALFTFGLTFFPAGSFGFLLGTEEKLVFFVATARPVLATRDVFFFVATDFFFLATGTDRIFLAVESDCFAL